MYLLDAHQQRRVVAAIADEPRACVLRNRGIVQGWLLGRPLPDRPLVRYIARSFRLQTDFGGGYQLLVRRAS
jgi:hypothetical protein